MAISPKNKKSLGKSSGVHWKIATESQGTPGSTGAIYIKRDLLLLLNKQLEQSGEDEGPTNIAGGK